MCSEIATSTKQQCKLSKNKSICHMHKKKKLLGYIKSEIINLNKTVEKKNNKIKCLDKQIESKTNEIVKLNEDIYELNIEKSELQEENDILREENEAMKEDFNNYQFIKRFEAIKYNLKKYVDIKDYNQILFFCIQRKNHDILESIMGYQEDYYKYFNRLRLRRNKLSHWYY